MASYLSDYKQAAQDREKKICRAVESALSQTINAELVVVSDGCQKTIDILTEKYPDQFSGYLIQHRSMWSGRPRNTGIERAKNNIICYLDIDDYLKKDHCEKIVENFGNNDWVWFDDFIRSKKSGWKIRNCNIEKRGFCGTSNIAHKKVALWPEKGSYAHDWSWIQNLKKWSNKYKYIGHGGYYVCHVPGRYDV